MQTLWTLSHRPWWLIGVVADVLSVVLHVIALSMATLSLVQPLGVMGVVFAIPLGAAVRGRRIRPLEVAAASVVLLAFTAILESLPASTGTVAPSLGSVLGLAVLTAVVVSLATAGAHRSSGRRRALLLTGGAVTAFGVTALLVRSPGASVPSSIDEMVGHETTGHGDILVR